MTAQPFHAASDLPPLQPPKTYWTGRKRRYLGVLWWQYEYNTPVYTGARWQNPWNTDRWPRRNFWARRKTAPKGCRLTATHLTEHYLSDVESLAMSAESQGDDTLARDIRAVANAAQNAAHLRLRSW
ncbi:MAG: hypothetical protein JJ902_22670 [Roseibium sp.]|nr:hypothetical protein [Roseibium sp.]